MIEFIFLKIGLADYLISVNIFKVGQNNWRISMPISIYYQLSESLI